MSLESQIAGLTEIMTKIHAQNETVISLAQEHAGKKSSADDALAAAAAAKTTAKKTTTKKTEAADGSKSVTKAELSTGLSAWLNEFGKPDAHVESKARHAALKAVLTKVGLATLKDLAEDDTKNIEKLHNWLENTAKLADKGHGIGLLVAPPEEAGEADADDDDMGI